LRRRLVAAAAAGRLAHLRGPRRRGARRGARRAPRAAAGGVQGGLGPAGVRARTGAGARPHPLLELARPARPRRAPHTAAAGRGTRDVAAPRRDRRRGRPLPASRDQGPRPRGRGQGSAARARSVRSGAAGEAASQGHVVAGGADRDRAARGASARAHRTLLPAAPQALVEEVSRGGRALSARARRDRRARRGSRDAAGEPAPARTAAAVGVGARAGPGGERDRRPARGAGRPPLAGGTVRPGDPPGPHRAGLTAGGPQSRPGRAMNGASAARSAAVPCPWARSVWRASSAETVVALVIRPSSTAVTASPSGTQRWSSSASSSLRSNSSVFSWTLSARYTRITSSFPPGLGRRSTRVRSGLAGS